MTFSGQNLAKYCSTMDLKMGISADIFTYILLKNSNMAMKSKLLFCIYILKELISFIYQLFLSFEKN